MKLTIRETTKADNETIYLIEKHAFGEVERGPIFGLRSYWPNQPLSRFYLFQHLMRINLSDISCLRKQHSRITNSILVMILGPFSRYARLSKARNRRTIDQRRTAPAAAKSTLSQSLSQVISSTIPKHGFKPALPLDFQAPYPVEKGKEDAWMVQALKADFPIEDYAGTVRCCDEFMRPEYWREQTIQTLIPKVRYKGFFFADLAEVVYNKRK